MHSPPNQASHLASLVVAAGIVVMFGLGLKSYRAHIATEMYLGGLDEILEMQDEIAAQLDVIERNATEARDVLRMLKEGRLDPDDPEMLELEEKILGRLEALKKSFDKEVKAITEISKGAVERFRKLVEGDPDADATSRHGTSAAGHDGDAAGQQWVVKWHNNGVSTSPRFHSEAQAYRYFVNVGDFAKKLIAYDGQRWAVIKTYGGRQWLSQMTDDGSFQSTGAS
eukprot:TRINITY_DN60226_c0_g1_i1.p2 TRINITY_DN60226_c0_g1~~TRINITY_DN60226_c0_g1_i1.p2  ORF type:complete len:226 (+),score=102.89 TRINITY_DN60226_c0_g1_i1:198-875(+)